MTELEQQKARHEEFAERNAKALELMKTGGRPDHYNDAVTPQEYADANMLPFDEGNVVKYVSRHKRKNGAEDVIKAMHYCMFVLYRDYRLVSSASVHNENGPVKILTVPFEGNKQDL